MRFPIIPLIVASVVIGGALLLFNRASGPPALVMAAPDVGEFLDVMGVETEIAISPEGDRQAIIASGDVWVAGNGAEPRRITATAEPESAPAWDSEGALLFTRGTTTYRVDPGGGGETVHRENATGLVQAGDGREAFARDGAVWIASSAADTGEALTEADPAGEISFRSIRFSPDGNQLALIRSIGRLHGQLIGVDLESGTVRPIVTDRVAESPTGVEWIDDRRLAYVTDRAGGIAVWHVNLDENTLLPLTASMMSRALAPLGIDVVGERILVPVHEFRSDIALLDGRLIVSGEVSESEPAFSPAGNRLAYTVEAEGVFEIWAALGDGTGARYVTLGRRPRLSPNGLELVFARTDPDGNRDIWKTDIRTGIPTRLTDDPALDDTPDWSPDGRTVVFYSEAGGGPGIWTLPATGGQRVRFADEGYWPRYSEDGRHLAYWTPAGFVIRTAAGEPAGRAEAGPVVAPPIWIGGEVYGVEEMRLPEPLASAGEPGLFGPVLDRGPDGQWAVERIDVRSTAIWRIDLQYTEE